MPFPTYPCTRRTIAGEKWTAGSKSHALTAGTQRLLYLLHFFEDDIRWY